MRVALKNSDTATSAANVLDLTDFCKGLAIVWVFLVHYQGYWFGWQGVHIFIVLSGFGLTYACLSRSTNIDWRRWFYRRMRKLLPAYWLAVLLFFPLLVLFQIILEDHLWQSVIRTALDLLLLTNFFESFKGGATGAFWFVPFIVSAYFIFPFLYSWIKELCSFKKAWSVLLTVMAIEFIYRAVAIYWLDGLPMSFDHKFLAIIPDSVQQMEQHGNWMFGFFQQRAPFGFIPARLIEFTLGMVAAALLVKAPRKMNRLLLNPQTGCLGVLIWLVGQALLYVGLWGWIFADAIISLGLILWVLNLANLLQNSVPGLFRALTEIGMWSYYIYLTHQPFTRLFRGMELLIVGDDVSGSLHLIATCLSLTLTIATTFIASLILKNFDRTQFADQMVTFVVNRFGKFFRTV